MRKRPDLIIEVGNFVDGVFVPSAPEPLSLPKPKPIPPPSRDFDDRPFQQKIVERRRKTLSHIGAHVWWRDLVVKK
jgi:hypothetical protein